MNSPFKLCYYILTLYNRSYILFFITLPALLIFVKLLPSKLGPIFVTIISALLIGILLVNDDLGKKVPYSLNMKETTNTDELNLLSLFLFWTAVLSSIFTLIVGLMDVFLHCPTMMKFSNLVNVYEVKNKQVWVLIGAAKLF